MSKMKLTNNTKGPRIVNTTEGPVTLAPGESQTLDLSEGEAKALKRTGHLGGPGEAPVDEPIIEGGPTDAQVQIKELVDGNDKNQLLELAEKEEVEGVTADNNKTEIATKIVEKRLAA